MKKKKKERKKGEEQEQEEEEEEEEIKRVKRCLEYRNRGDQLYITICLKEEGKVTWVLHHTTRNIPRFARARI